MIFRKFRSLVLRIANSASLSQKTNNENHPKAAPDKEEAQNRVSNTPNLVNKKTSNTNSLTCG